MERTTALASGKTSRVVATNGETPPGGALARSAESAGDPTHEIQALRVLNEVKDELMARLLTDRVEQFQRPWQIVLDVVEERPAAVRISQPYSKVFPRSSGANLTDRRRRT